MALFSNLYALKLQRVEKILRKTRGAKGARMAKFWQFSAAHPNLHFLIKCKEGTKGNFSKIAQKVALA